ncbi:cation-transporting P-type ATPase [Streptomyces sp. SAS_276]|uniref:cation-transporting P-type ATPase n=1 Tax=Streptomyces sp. SAS_276 TaxID=3412745 RepID=UPI00403C6947
MNVSTGRSPGWCQFSEAVGPVVPDHVVREPVAELDGAGSRLADPLEPLTLLLQHLRSSAGGLSEREAARRLEVYGPNELVRNWTNSSPRKAKWSSPAARPKPNSASPTPCARRARSSP